MMRNLAIVTTSWDDAYPADLRLAELLQKHDLRGTFYCPIHGEEGRPTLSSHELRRLRSAGFEIGAHSLSHCVLSAVRPSAAQEEIFGSKRELEDLLGDEVRMFCYPRGHANAHAIRCVREAGYRGARGTQLLSIEATFSPFLMPTTVQAVPHRPSNYVKNLTRRRAWGSLYRYCSQLRGYRDWVVLGKRLFDDAVKSGGVWHLWGHSWEIEQLGLWPDLEGLFAYVSRQAGVLYASNGSTIDTVEALQLGSGVEKAV
jgi:hypothetical protein